jgi:CPA2 family monovalent cation:H+ antiporter-2
MVEMARTVNPRIAAVVRTHRDEQLTSLENQIAGKVFLGEHELAVSMTRYVLEAYEK